MENVKWMASVAKESKIEPLTVKDLEYKGYGCRGTIFKYVKQGMPRHGKQGAYWFLEPEVREWIMWRGEKQFIQCPNCGKLIEVNKCE